MSDGARPVPSTLRLLASPSAVVMTDLMAVFDDLQTVLRCCEHLVTELGRHDAEPDAIQIEAVWTLALLSYARGFADGRGAAALTEDDLVHAQGHENVLDWHRVLLRLRDHYADPVTNPRERFSVGVAQEADGSPSGIAVTSVRQPMVDDVTVRQAGAIAFALSNAVNDRISAQQQQLFGEVRQSTMIDLAKLPVLEVTSPA